MQPSVVIFLNTLLLLAPSHCVTRTKMFQSYWVSTNHGRFSLRSQDLCVRENNLIFRKYLRQKGIFFRPYMSKDETVHPFLCSLNLIYMYPNANTTYSFDNGKCQRRGVHQSVYAGPKHGLEV